MDIRDQFIGIRSDDRESSNPLACGRLFPIFPNAIKAERRAVLHGNRVGLLGFLTLNSLPLEKAIHRHEASALAVGFVEGRQLPHRLALGIDRPAPTSWVLAP